MQYNLKLIIHLTFSAMKTKEKSNTPNPVAAKLVSKAKELPTAKPGTPKINLTKKDDVAKKPVKKELEKANVAITEEKALQKVVVNRELKYKYPEDMTDTLKRKAYRQKIRNQLNTMQLELLELQGKDKASKEKEIEAFKKTIFA